MTDEMDGAMMAVWMKQAEMGAKLADAMHYLMMQMVSTMNAPPIWRSGRGRWHLRALMLWLEAAVVA